MDEEDRDSLTPVPRLSAMERKMKVVLGIVVLSLLLNAGHAATIGSNKLKAIRSLSESMEVGSWIHRMPKDVSQNPDICYNDGCLDAGGYRETYAESQFIN